MLVTKYNETVLLLAVPGGHMDVVELLLKNGADVNASDENYGRAALHVASRENHFDVVKLLIQNGADVTALD